jgi:hypothetical protein
MRIKTVGYYEIYGYNPITANEDKWLGTGTAEAAQKIGARLGGFIGYDEITSDGWACKAS